MSMKLNIKSPLHKSVINHNMQARESISYMDSTKLRGGHTAQIQGAPSEIHSSVHVC